MVSSLLWLLVTASWLCASAIVAAAGNETDLGLPVLTFSPVVAAGVPFLVTYNASNNEIAVEGHRRMVIYVRAAPREQNGESWIWDTYCVAAPCVATNVTTFAVTIPPDAFPSGDYGYGFIINLVNSEKVGWSHWYGHHDLGFNITGATTQWNDFEKDHGPWGLGHWTIPCSALGCARECQNKYIAPYFPHSPETEALGTCVESCPGYGLGTGMDVDCVVTNATEADLLVPSATATTGAPESTTSPEEPSLAGLDSQPLGSSSILVIIVACLLSTF